MYILTGNRRRAQMKRPKLQHDSALYLVRITTFSIFWSCVLRQYGTPCNIMTTTTVLKMTKSITFTPKMPIALIEFYKIIQK